MQNDWMNALNVFTVATLYIQMTLCIILNGISLTFMIYFKMFTPINMLIINLAIADILYSGCVPYYVRQFDDMPSSQSAFGCRISFIIDVTCMIVNVFTVSALTIERYTCLKEKSLNPNDACKKRVIFIYIVVLWVSAVGFSLPKALSIVEKTYKSNNGTETIVQCESTFDQSYEVVYTISKWIVAFLLPYGLIIFFSCSLLRFLTKWSNRSKRLHQTNRMRTANEKQLAITNGSINDKDKPLLASSGDRKKVKIADETVSTAFVTPNESEYLRLPNKHLVDSNSAINSSRKSSSFIEDEKNSFDICSARRTSNTTLARQTTMSNLETEALSSASCIQQQQQQQQQVKQAPLNSLSSASSAHSRTQLIVGQGVKKQGTRQSVIKKRTTRFVLAVVISFLCAWSPFWIFQIVVMFIESLESNLLPIARNLTLIFLYFEGVTNPLLFLILTENFREFVSSKLKYYRKK